MITTHVLDTNRGRPANGVRVELEARDSSGSWRQIGHGTTDGDGRLRTLMPDGVPVEPGAYRLTFDTGEYFARRGVAAFYPRVTVEFTTAAGEAHYHVPLLISPFGYTTYRGS